MGRAVTRVAIKSPVAILNGAQGPTATVERQRGGCKVLAVRHQLQMLGVAATSVEARVSTFAEARVCRLVMAHVVDGCAIGDRTDVALEHEPVDADVPDSPVPGP